jgi:hypothetical protein
VTPPVGLFQVLVVDNAAADQSADPVAAVANMGNLSNPVTATVTAPARALVFAVADDWNSVSNPPGVPFGQYVFSNVANRPDVDTYSLSALTAPTATAGPVTMTQTLSQPDNWHMLAWASHPLELALLIENIPGVLPEAINQLGTAQ